MKTTMNITVTPKLKKDFSEFAKSIETTPTNLLNMLMKHTLITRKVSFESEDNILHSIAYEDMPARVQASYNAIQGKSLEELELVNI